MPIVVLEVGAKHVRLLHQSLSFREGVNTNFIFRADKASNIKLANLMTIVHFANFFIEALLMSLNSLAH